MSDTPFFRGKDAVFRLFQDGKEELLNAKTWSVKRNTSDGADGVNGEDRDRPYSVSWINRARGSAKSGIVYSPVLTMEGGPPVAQAARLHPARLSS